MVFNKCSVQGKGRGSSEWTGVVKEDFTLKMELQLNFEYQTAFGQGEEREWEMLRFRVSVTLLQVFQ